MRAPSIARAAWLLPLLIGLWACDDPKPAPRAAPPTMAPADSIAPASAPPPVTAEAPLPTAAPKPLPPHAGEMVSLPVDGFEPAVVAVPGAAETPQPMLVATHGNFDRPEWQCDEWRRVLGNRGFVLCPRGEARPDSPAGDTRYTYASNQVLEKELMASIETLITSFTGFVDGEGPIVYTGFSLGAITGVKIAARHPARFPRMVLVEGGHDAWTPGRAKSYATGGGKRVLFVCAQRGCELAAGAAAKRLEHAGAETRVVSKPGLGHTYGGPLNELIDQQLPWLLEGDPRWTANQISSQSRR